MVLYSQRSVFKASKIIFPEIISVKDGKKGWQYGAPYA
jgi:hypothetical protein